MIYLNTEVLFELNIWKVFKNDHDILAQFMTLNMIST